jgi:hypothetical protein
VNVAENLQRSRAYRCCDQSRIVHLSHPRATSPEPARVTFRAVGLN